MNKKCRVGLNNNIDCTVHKPEPNDREDPSKKLSNESLSPIKKTHNMEMKFNKNERALKNKNVNTNKRKLKNLQKKLKRKRRMKTEMKDKSVITRRVLR